MRSLRTGFIAATLLLTACARTEPAQEEQADTIARDAEQPDGATAISDPLTQGAWAVGSEAMFEGASGEVQLIIRCDQRRGLIVQRPGLVPRGQLALMQMRIGGVVRRLAVTASVSGSPMIEVVVPYNDQLIAPLMRFDKPLEVRFPSLDTLNLPPSWKVAGFVRDCQSAIPQQAGNAVAPATSNID